MQFGYIQIAVSEVCFDAGVWRSWGDALSKQSCELFVAKARECFKHERGSALGATCIILFASCVFIVNNI